jgi:hypothetical protein
MTIPELAEALGMTMSRLTTRHCRLVLRRQRTFPADERVAHEIGNPEEDERNQ